MTATLTILRVCLTAGNNTCDVCDETIALCNEEGSEGVGSLLAPLDGYWHSSPFSPQVGLIAHKSAIAVSTVGCVSCFLLPCFLYCISS